MSADRITLEHVRGGPWKGEAETTGFTAQKAVIEEATLFEAMRKAAEFFGEADRPPGDDDDDKAVGDDADDEALAAAHDALHLANAAVTDLSAKVEAGEKKISELTAHIVELMKPVAISPTMAGGTGGGGGAKSD